MTADDPIAITLTVNRRRRTALVQPTETLLTTLRDGFGLTGAKRGCNQGVCGACTVLRDGTPVRACLTLAALAQTGDYTTIEGLAAPSALTPVQQSFARSGAAQCGFCTSGMLLTAHALLQTNPHPTRDEVRHGLAGNLCRCTGYQKIVDAVCAAMGNDAVCVAS